MILVDASLATKLIIAEADSNVAKSWYLAETEEIGAPDLIAIEVAQAIVRRVNTRMLARSGGQAAIIQWRTILEQRGIDLMRTTPAHVANASDIAMTLGHPLSDCIYLALAIDLDCDLATCDAKFRDKAFPIFGRVRLLSELTAH